jgi:hypothetical protein
MAEKDGRTSEWITVLLTPIAFCTCVSLSLVQDHSLVVLSPALKMDATGQHLMLNAEVPEHIRFSTPTVWVSGGVDEYDNALLPPTSERFMSVPSRRVPPCKRLAHELQRMVRQTDNTIHVQRGQLMTGTACVCVCVCVRVGTCVCVCECLSPRPSWMNRSVCTARQSILRISSS